MCYLFYSDTESVHCICVYVCAVQFYIGNNRSAWFFNLINFSLIRPAIRGLSTKKTTEKDTWYFSIILALCSTTFIPNFPFHKIVIFGLKLSAYHCLQKKKQQKVVHYLHTQRHTYMFFFHMIHLQFLITNHS